MTTASRNCSILVTDDDEGDRFLIRKAMAAGGMEGSLLFLEDGQRLVDYLQGCLGPSPEVQAREMPCLILLDLNMPRLDGREALRIVKNHERLREIPVVILTNSRNPADIAACYKEGANSFFTKPLDYKDLVSLMGLLKAYWLQAAELPFEGGGV